VLQTLQHGDDEQRWAAARLAAEVPDGATALIAALPREAVPRVREAMLTSLSRIGSAQSFDAIVILLRSDDASTRAAALDALRPMMPVHWQRLPQLLSDADSDVRVLSCELARSLSGADATQMLGELLLRETQPNVCAAAIDVLAEVADTSALPFLAHCASRFADIPFLVFAIKIATTRIQAQPNR
jgi:HEAT repeat protein